MVHDIAAQQKAVVAMPASLPVALSVGRFSPSEDWVQPAPIVILGPLCMLTGIVAVRHASTAMLAPYTLLRLVIGLLGTGHHFPRVAGRTQLRGAGVILGSYMLSSGTFRMTK